MGLKNASQWDGESRHAAGVARHVSRLLRAAGLTMSKKLDRWTWTDGLHVSRVGCGSDVSIGYYQRYGFRRSDQTDILEAARKTVEDAGYTIDDRYWINTTIERKESK